MKESIPGQEIAKDLRFQDLLLNVEIRQLYPITKVVYDQFLTIFKDYSPIHVDSNFAKSEGFDGPILHGAVLNGFLSHFIGMHCPGRRALLLSVNLDYLKPSYLGDVIELMGRVVQKNNSMRVVVLHVQFFNQTRREIVARGRVQVRVRSE